jgi:hypothetical protein
MENDDEKLKIEQEEDALGEDELEGTIRTR